MAGRTIPSQELLASLDPSHVLIADIEQGRIPRDDRDQEFRGAPWLFGGLWEFGGRTTMGAPLYDYAVRFPTMAHAPAAASQEQRSSPKASTRTPSRSTSTPRWPGTPSPSTSAIGPTTTHSAAMARMIPTRSRAWQILLKTAYSYRADGNMKHGERDASHDSLFNAQPSLTTYAAAHWSPDVMRYNPTDFAPALTELLQVAPSLRTTETYRYDLVDVARQVMANESRDHAAADQSRLRL